MDNIVSMPFSDNELTDQDIVNLFMGLVRLVKRQYENRINKLLSEITDLTQQLHQTSQSSR